MRNFKMLAIPLALAVAGCDLLGFGGNQSIAELATTWGTTGNKDGQFQYVEDLAIGCDGNIYVTDAKNSNVQVFAPDGKFVTKFGVMGQGKEGDEMMKPEGIAVDKNCNIYVADYTTGFIKKFSKDYKWLLSFGAYGSGPGQNIRARPE